jgi:hypothetical protein
MEVNDIKAKTFLECEILGFHSGFITPEGKNAI